MENPSTHSPGGSAALTREEIEALPERVRQYIADLHQEIAKLRAGKAHAESEFQDLRRKHNWSRPRR